MAASKPKTKTRQVDIPRHVATTADLVLKFSIGCPDSPFFRLTQREREGVERGFVQELARIFPPNVRRSWLNQRFPLKFRGPENVEIKLDPAIIDSQREYLRLYFEYKLRDLLAAAAPAGFQDDEPRYTTSETPPDDPCVMCVIIDRKHVCMRCANLELYGVKYTLSNQTRLGLIEAQVSIQLSWEQDV
jgi:hypothetical protein